MSNLLRVRCEHTCREKFSSKNVALLYLLKQLQAVGVVIICEVHHPGLDAVFTEGLPEPAHGQVPLYGPPRYSGVLSVPSYLIVSRCLHVEVCVVESSLLEEIAD